MPQYNNAQIRKWVTEFFADPEDFDFFAEDNFPDIHAQFIADMSLNKKARLLTKYCEANNQYDRLLTLLKDEDPDHFAAFPPPEPEGDEAVASTSPTASVKTSPPPPISMPPPVTDPDLFEESGEQDEVFISYVPEDVDFVSQLHQELTDMGISAWFGEQKVSAGDHWQTSVVTGIRGCKVFLLVLSPEAAASTAVRRELDLAGRHNKQIVPLMWHPTKIPIAMEYYLSNITHIDFAGSNSSDNFAELIDILISVIGGVTLDQATQDKQLAKAALVPTIEKELPQSAAPEKKRLGFKKKKRPGLNPIALGGLVISGVVTTFGLDAEDWDFVNEELMWLFYAADHTLKINEGEVPGDAPVPYTIPPDAEKRPNANEGRLTHPAQARGQAVGIRAVFSRIKTELEILDTALEQEANLGEAAAINLPLQYQIKTQRIEVVKQLIQLASGMEQAYGIRVYSPKQLLELLEDSNLD